MKAGGCLLVMLIAAGVSGFLGCMALYVLQSGLASESVRISPVIPAAMAQVVADGVADWTLGAPAHDIVLSAPDTCPGGADAACETPDDDGKVEFGGTYTGTVPGNPDCKVPSGWPVDGYLTQGFRPPSNPSHTGIDIGVRTGTPDLATMCGTVTFAGWSAVGYGNLVIVSNGEYQTYYAHNAVVAVGTGQKVEVGQTLALSGSTGHSTGPHVHYEVRINGVPVDPVGFP